MSPFCTRTLRLLSSLVLIVILLASNLGAAAPAASVELQAVGSYSAGAFNQGAAEIVAYDPKTRRLFVVNGAASSIDVLDMSDPTALNLLFSINLLAYGRQANSVAVDKGVVAVAVEAFDKTAPGKVVFYDTDGNFLNAVNVGALPDMLTFTPNGKAVLVANEGEPNSYNQPDSVDPEGSVSIIDLQHGVARLSQSDVVTAGFSAFNPATLDASIRIFGPNASAAQDFEPEYITVSHDSKTAWVTLQENNAIGVLDIKSGIFTELIGLGFKNHSLTGNGLDASDRDGPGNTPRINIANWPVFGLYQPDAIASFRHHGNTFLITANEGDARDYTGFSEEKRVSSLALDPTAFPNAAALKTNAQLGRLNVTSANGDAGGDGDYDQLYAFGARSFSIRSATGALVFDSEDQFEQITAQLLPAYFNSSNDSNNSFDTRSDNKGPEPEDVTVGELWGRTYAFIGLERIGGIMIYDITDPFRPFFVQYINNRNFSGVAEAGTGGDLGPEGLLLIPGSDSPTHKPLLVVANEVSGTTTVYEISRKS
ncbi:MAG: choice-of-anchor I family protein [Acidobacteria bacterium]|nr:choice-of-anchor I family protein [Acidobacteriota bacterium]